MANRFLTRTEVVLEVGIPLLRAAILCAEAKLKLGEADVTVPNPVRDCVPLVFERSALENGGASEMLAKLDLIEAECRGRIAP